MLEPQGPAFAEYSQNYESATNQHCTLQKIRDRKGGEAGGESHCIEQSGIWRELQVRDKCEQHWVTDWALSSTQCSEAERCARAVKGRSLICVWIVNWCLFDLLKEKWVNAARGGHVPPSQSHKWGGGTGGTSAQPFGCLQILFTFCLKFFNNYRILEFSKQIKISKISQNFLKFSQKLLNFLN